MRNFTWKEYAIVALLIVVLLMAYYAVSSSSESSPSNPELLTARYTLYLVWATVSLLIIPLIQFYFLSETIKVTKESVEAALNANRSWLDFSIEVVGPLSWLDEAETTLGLVVQANIENVGNSPAINTRVGTAARYLAGSSKVPNYDSSVKSTIFPGKILKTERLFAFLHENQIRRALTLSFGSRNINLIVEIEVTYEYNGGEGRTFKSFQIVGRDMMESINLKYLPLQSSDLNVKQLQYLDRAS